MSGIDRITPLEIHISVKFADPAFVSKKNPEGEIEEQVGMRADINAAANIERVAAEQLLTGITMGAAPTLAVVDLAYAFHRSYHMARDQAPRYTRSKFGAVIGYAFEEFGNAVERLSEVLKLDDDGEPGDAPNPPAAEAETTGSK